MSDCERDLTSPAAPGVIAIDLCCVLDCEEVAPTGSVFTLRIPAMTIGTVHSAALTPPVTLPRLLLQQRWLQSPSFIPPDTYLKNLALLI